MSRGIRREAIGMTMGLLDTVADAAAIVAEAASLLQSTCTAACDRLSDRYTVETDAHRGARERLSC